MQDLQGLYKSGQPHFADPAIMSAARFQPPPETNYMHPMDMTYGPPPGLSFPPALQNLNIATPPVGMNDGHGHPHGELQFSFSEGRDACVPSCRAFSAEDPFLALRMHSASHPLCSIHGLISPLDPEVFLYGRT